MSREDRERAVQANWRAYKEQMFDLIDDVDHQLAVARNRRQQRRATRIVVRKTWPLDYPDFDDLEAVLYR